MTSEVLYSLDDLKLEIADLEKEKKLLLAQVARSNSRLKRESDGKPIKSSALTALSLQLSQLDHELARTTKECHKIEKSSVFQQYFQETKLSQQLKAEIDELYKQEQIKKAKIEKYQTAINNLKTSETSERYYLISKKLQGCMSRLSQFREVNRCLIQKIEKLDNR